MNVLEVRCCMCSDAVRCMYAAVDFFDVCFTFLTECDSGRVNELHVRNVGLVCGYYC